jgi:hypothetical protein
MNSSNSTVSFTGTSQRGDLGEAIADAIKNITSSSQSSDPLISWTIEEISGKLGGIAGLDEISVTIATIQQTP